MPLKTNPPSGEILDIFPTTQNTSITLTDSDYVMATLIKELIGSINKLTLSMNKI